MDNAPRGEYAISPDPPRPLRLAVLAAPGVPGARALLDRARARLLARGALSVALAGDGLGWLEEGAFLADLVEEGATVLVCSQSARAAKVGLDDLPEGVRPSSLVAWLRGHDAATHDLWAALP